MPFLRPSLLSERYGLGLTQVTASGSILSVPALVYSIVVSLLNTAATGVAKLNDGTTSGFSEGAEGSLTLRLTGGAVTGGSPSVESLSFNPPLKLDSGLFCSATGVSIAVARETSLD